MVDMADKQPTLPDFPVPSAKSIPQALPAVTLPTHEPNITTLSPIDLAAVRQAIGASFDAEEVLRHPKSVALFPSRGLKPGLYRDVVRSRTIAQYQFYFTSGFVNIALILQLFIGAVMTALASGERADHVALTVLAAANTITAGLAATMHNSGLPDRYKKDWTEFERVEMYLKEVMETGLVTKGVTREDVIKSCYESYVTAKATIDSNKPGSYTGTGEKGTATSAAASSKRT